MLRRAAWMKWLPPIPDRSPSPEKTTDLELGAAELEPGGEGNRPAVGGVEGVELHVAGDAAGAADAGDDGHLVEVDIGLLEGAWRST